MSGLQKIFNILHSCPKASHFKVRDLNVYFKNSINPTYKLINLDNIDSLELQIEVDNKESKNYNLIAYIVKSSKENGVFLASFETKKEAVDALDKVKNKLFGGGKTILGIANGLALLIIYTTFLLSFGGIFKSPIKQSQDMSNIPNLGMNPSGIPNMNFKIPGTENGTVNMDDMSKLQKKLLQQALQQSGQQRMPESTGMPDPSSQQLPDTGALMNDIVSKALNQSSTQNHAQTEQIPQDTSPAQLTNIVEQPATQGDELLSQIK